MELQTMQCPNQKRRSILLTALATGACLATKSVVAEDQPGSDERPQTGDLLVVSEGEHEGDVITPGDLKLGGPPQRAWPKDPNTSVVRNGSRLNEILVIKLEASELDDATRVRAADGIIAYSAICTHAGCLVSECVRAAQGEQNVLKCPCHNSEFDPPTKRRSRIWACASTPSRSSASDRRRLAHRGWIVCRKGWVCSKEDDGRLNCELCIDVTLGDVVARHCRTDGSDQ